MVRARRAAAAALVLALSLAALAVGAQPDPRLGSTLEPPGPLAAVTWPPSSGVLLAEVVTGGASASDEYVELTNASTVAVDLGGLELVYATSSGSTVTRKATWASPRPLAPGQHLLVANASGAFAALADATYSGGLAATGGALALRPVGGTPIDAVGWGDATSGFVEGTVAPAPPAGSSIERRPGGSAGSGTDTNDNATDWIVQATPEPRNLAAPPLPSPTPVPSPGQSPGQSPSPSPTPTPTPSPSPTPTPTPSPTPSPSPTPTPTPSPSPTPTPSPSPTPTPTPTPVEDIATGRTMPMGAGVAVEGTVTVGFGLIESGRSGFVQDETGGIAIYLDAPATSVLPPGTRVRVSGTVDDRYAQRTIRASADAIVDLGTWALPAPVTIPTGTAGESIEGLRIEVVGTIVEAPSAFADGLGLLVDDGTGPLRAIVGPAALGGSNPVRGDRVTVIGPLGQHDSTGTGMTGYRILSMASGELEVRPAPSPTQSPSPTPGPTTTPGPSDPATPSPSMGSSSSPTPPPPDPDPTATRDPDPTATPAVPSIALVRTLSIGTSATVDGVVTARSGQIGDLGLIGLGDGSAGIVVRLPAGLVAPVRGAHVIVTGKLADPYGQLEIRPELGGIVPGVGPGTPPTAVPVAATGLGEANEGTLAILTGVIEHAPTSTTGGGLTTTLVDAAGGRARISTGPSSGLVRSDFLVGHRYQLTGLVGQRASKKGALDGYRLWVRDAADIVHLAGPVASPTPTPGPSSSPAGVPLVSIAHALTMQGRAVTVLGVVTTPARLLDATGRRIVVQDASGAIEVRTPTGTTTPSPGRRIRVTGEVVRAYDAPRIKATAIADLGPAAIPAARSLSHEPSVAVEWQLVRVAGTVVDVHKLGDRWRAELRVGAAKVVVQGQSGAAIPSTTLVEGRRATVVGIARRPYPGTADRRYAVLPRSTSDIAVGPASPAPGASPRGSSTARTSPTTSGAAGLDGATGRVSPDAPTFGLGDLADHPGARVKVGGLVVDLVADGFTLDDGSAIGRVVLRDEAAAFLGLVEPGDAVDAIGRVELDADGVRLVVEAGADLIRLGSLGEPDPSPSSSTDPAGGVAAAAPSDGPGAPLAGPVGVAGSSDPTTLMTGCLALAIGGSAALALVRRRRSRRALAARIAVRVAALGGPASSSRA